MAWLTFRDMIKKAQQIFEFESYLYAGTIARWSLQKHRVSYRACVCYVNWANGEFTEQQIADRLGIPQTDVAQMVGTVRQVWRHLPGKPLVISKIIPLNLEQHNESVIAKW
jgi:hypothetical protein